MVAEVQIEFDDREVREFFSNLSKKTDQISKRDQAVVGILSAVVFKDIMDHFDRQEGPDGRWKAWSPSYARFMASIGKYGNRILQDTGNLRQSFRPTNVQTSAEGITWFNPAQTKSGFPYAAAHDEGSGKLPQRRFMWLSDPALERIEEEILKFLDT